MISEFITYFENKDIFELFSQTIFAAPPAISPIAPIEHESLDEIILSLPEDELWRVGNSFLKRKDIQSAQKYYHAYLKQFGHKEKILALLGLTYLIQGKTNKDSLEKAKYYLKRALVKNPELDEARLWLLYYNINFGLNTQISKHFLHLKLSPNKKIQALCEYLKYYSLVKRHKLNELKKVYKNILTHPNESFSKEVLVLHEYYEGQEKFLNGDLVSASKIWAKSYLNYSDQWFSQPAIASNFNSLSKAKIYFLDSRKAKNNIYELVLEKLFQLSLIPEFFEDKKSILEKETYWKSQLGGKGTYPYAYYRYALCLLYRGDFQEAYETFLICRDKIPSSKVDYFKVDEIIDWTRDQIENVKSQSETDGLNNKKQELRVDETGWDEFDKEDKLLIAGWKHYFKFKKHAVEWSNNGFNDPLIASRWSNLGATPKEAIDWSKIFIDKPLIAFAYYAVGFRDPKVAYNWSKDFSVPIEAWECYMNGSSPNQIRNK